jgi:hypothetical protein
MVLSGMRTDLIFDRQRRARIEQMIAEYQATKARRLMQLALNDWQNAGATQPLLDLEKPPTRVH